MMIVTNDNNEKMILFKDGNIEKIVKVGSVIIPKQAHNYDTGLFNYLFRIKSIK